MPKRVKKDKGKGKASHIPPTASILPDADEEHATTSIINRWVALADAALNSEHPPNTQESIKVSPCRPAVNHSSGLFL